MSEPQDYAKLLKAAVDALKLTHDFQQDFLIAKGILQCNFVLPTSTLVETEPCTCASKSFICGFCKDSVKFKAHDPYCKRHPSPIQAKSIECPFCKH